MTQAAAPKRRETPRGRPGRAGLRLCSKWLGYIPTLRSAKAQPVGEARQPNVARPDPIWFGVGRSVCSRSWGAQCGGMPNCVVI
jgi:hypothetical protein